MSFEKELADLKERFTPGRAAKFIAGTLISFGATAAVIAMMKNPLQGARGVTRLLMKLGIFALACKAGDIAEDYFDKTVSEAENAFAEARKEVDSMKEAVKNA